MKVKYVAVGVNTDAEAILTCNECFDKKWLENANKLLNGEKVDNYIVKGDIVMSTDPDIKIAVTVREVVEITEMLKVAKESNVSYTCIENNKGDIRLAYCILGTSKAHAVVVDLNTFDLKAIDNKQIIDNLLSLSDGMSDDVLTRIYESI